MFHNSQSKLASPVGRDLELSTELQRRGSRAVHHRAEVGEEELVHVAIAPVATAQHGRAQRSAHVSLQVLGQPVRVGRALEAAHGLELASRASRTISLAPPGASAG